MVAEARTCPICKHVVPSTKEAARHRPFCSKRCADIDLSRWLNGVYAIPAAAMEEGAEAEIPGADEGDEGPQGPLVKH